MSDGKDQNEFMGYEEALMSQLFTLDALINVLERKKWLQKKRLLRRSRNCINRWRFQSHSFKKVTLPDLQETTYKDITLPIVQENIITNFLKVLYLKAPIIVTVSSQRLAIIGF